MISYLCALTILPLIHHGQNLIRGSKFETANSKLPRNDGNNELEHMPESGREVGRVREGWWET